MFRRALATLVISLSAVVVVAPAALANGPSTSVGPVSLDGLPGCC